MPFRIESVHLGEVKVIVPQVFHDERGFFYEVYRADQAETLGIPTTFLQLNQSCSVKGVIRGLHFQWNAPMGKLMRVTRGQAFLVAVDIRRESPTLGQWVGIEASADDCKQLWAPPGFARGFCALSEVAEIQYLCTATYNAQGESGIRWNDPDIGIQWPVTNPILSTKDRDAQTLNEWLNRAESAHFVYP